MRRSLVVVVGLALWRTGFAETDVCSLTVNGLVNNQTWTQTGSPYRVGCDLLIAGLEVEPGVEVLVDGAFKIEVLSSITALGTSPEPILFTATDPAVPWKGLRFQNTPPGSELTHCIIEGSDDGGLTLIDAVPPLLDHCTFRDNTKSGYGGGIDAVGLAGDFEIVGCDFSGNTASLHGGAIRANLDEDATLSVVDCSFQRNVSNPSTANGSYVGGALWLQTGNASIVGSRFFENLSNSRCSSSFDCRVLARGGAVYMGSNGTLTIETCEFEGNRTHAQNGGNCFFGGSSQSYGGALYVEAGVVTVTNSIFSGNLTTRSSCGASPAGGGVYVNGGMARVFNSTIARNPDATGVHQAGGTLEVTNSIIYFNNADSAQVGGTPTITYTDVQHGHEGDGNINFNPVFAGPGPVSEDLRIVPGSPCIDAGNPDPAFEDVCFPPSQGTSRNDMGARGGPGGCGWEFFDCNGNALSDDAEIAAGSARDCDADGIIDECEIRDGTLTDADSDGIADECLARSIRLVAAENDHPLCYNVVLRTDLAVLGGEIAVGVDPTVLTVTEISDLRIDGGRFVTEPPSPVNEPLLECNERGLAGVRIFWSVPDGEAPLAAGEHTLFQICVAYGDAEAGLCSPIEFVECLGAPESTGQNIITDAEGRSRSLFSPGLTVCPAIFARGDANDDGRFDASDAIVILTCEFASGPCPRCNDAADVNDDGEVNVADAVYLITWRFADGAAPAAPFPMCDRDSTHDGIPDCSNSNCP